MSHLVFDDSVVQKAEDRFAQIIMSQQPHLTRFYAKGIASQLTSLTINAEIFRLHGIEPASPEWMAQFPPATGQAPELIYVYAFLQGFYGLENLIDEAGADRNCGAIKMLMDDISDTECALVAWLADIAGPEAIDAEVDA